jgi:hypothetical protein
LTPYVVWEGFSCCHKNFLEGNHVWDIIVAYNFAGFLQVREVILPCNSPDPIHLEAPNLFEKIRNQIYLVVFFLHILVWIKCFFQLLNFFLKSLKLFLLVVCKWILFFKLRDGILLFIDNFFFTLSFFPYQRF